MLRLTKTHHLIIIMLTCGGKVILVKCTSGMMMEVVLSGYQYLKDQQVFRGAQGAQGHQGHQGRQGAVGAQGIKEFKVL